MFAQLQRVAVIFNSILSRWQVFLLNYVSKVLLSHVKSADFSENIKFRTSANRSFDKIDLKILTHLQSNGRLSMTELAEKVGMSATSCTERVRRLERDGGIAGYDAGKKFQASSVTLPWTLRDCRTLWQ